MMNIINLIFGWRLSIKKIKSMLAASAHPPLLRVCNPQETDCSKYYNNYMNYGEGKWQWVSNPQQQGGIINYDEKYYP